MRNALGELVRMIDIASLACALLSRRDAMAGAGDAESWAWLERAAGERESAVRALHSQLFVFHAPAERHELMRALRDALLQTPSVMGAVGDAVVAFFDADTGSLSASTADADAAVMARLGGGVEEASAVATEGDAVSGGDGGAASHSPSDPFATIAMIELALMASAPTVALHALWRWQRRRADLARADSRPYGFTTMAVRLLPATYEERRAMHVAWLLVRASTDPFAQALDCLTLLNLLHEQRVQAQGTPPPLLPIGGVLELVERAFSRAVPLMFGAAWPGAAGADGGAASPSKAPAPQKRASFSGSKGGRSGASGSESDDAVHTSVLLPRSLHALYVASDMLWSGVARSELHSQWQAHALTPPSSSTAAMANKALTQLGSLWTLLLPQYLDAAFAVSDAIGEQSFVRVATVVATLLANQCWRGTFARGSMLEQIVVFQALASRYAANAPEAQLSTDDLDLLPPMLNRSLRRLKVGGPHSLQLSAELRALVSSVGTVPTDVRGGVHVLQKLAVFLESTGDELVECVPNNSDVSADGGVCERLTMSALTGGRLDQLLFKQFTAAQQVGAVVVVEPEPMADVGAVVPPALLAVSDSVHESNVSVPLLLWRSSVALNVSAGVIQSAWRNARARRGTLAGESAPLAAQLASLQFARDTDEQGEAVQRAFALFVRSYRRLVLPHAVAVAQRVTEARSSGGRGGAALSAEVTLPLLGAVAGGWRALLEELAQLYATRHAQWRGSEYQCSVASDALRVHVQAIEAAERAQLPRVVAAAATAATQSAVASSAARYAEAEIAEDAERLGDDSPQSTPPASPANAAASPPSRRTKTKRGKQQQQQQQQTPQRDASESVVIRGALGDDDMMSEL
jgi:hypothetical protein